MFKSVPAVTIAAMAILFPLGSQANAGDLIQTFSDKLNSRDFIAYDRSLKDGDTGEMVSDEWQVRANVDYADVILDYDEHITSKAIDQLKMRQQGVTHNRKVYISGILKGLYLGEWTSHDGAFPILTRFPDHDGTDAHRFFLDNAAIGITANITDWITLYSQIEYHQIRFDSQDEIQFRKAYVTLGDLNASPFYLTFGRKTINWGNFDVYSPYTHTVSNHFFRAESDGPVLEVGYVNDYLNLTASLISGGRHLRTADTANENDLDNFAINGEFTLPVFEHAKLTIGGGYLHGTIYNHVVPHHPGPKAACNAFGMPVSAGVPECRGRNGAWDVHATFSTPSFDLMAEFTSTVDPWPATNEELTSLTVQGRYKTNIRGYDTHFTAAYSRGDIGPSGTAFNEIEQIVAGMEIFLNPHMSVGIEYSHNKSFAPLINVTTVSIDEVTADQIAIGARVVF